MENKLGVGKRGCSSMVEHRSSKPITRVRFPSPAWAQSPRTAVRGLADRCCSSAVERVLGKDEVLGSIPSSSSWKRTKFRFRFDSWNLELGSWNLVLETPFEIAEERWLRTSLRGPNRTSTWARSVTLSMLKIRRPP